MANVAFEEFPSVFALYDAINKRNDNGHADHSATKERAWSGFPTWELAKDAYLNGIQSVCDKLNEATRAYRAKCNAESIRKQNELYYNGFAPNVARAIIGHPKAMMRRTKINIPSKGINLIWCSNVACDVEAKDIENAGICVFKAIYRLESLGYRVSLVNACFSSESNGEKAVCVVRLKESGQHLDTLKLSFPLGSASMFRRFGFRWLETAPSITKSFHSTYGYPMSKKDIVNIVNQYGKHTDADAYAINVADCQKVKYNTDELLKSLGIIA